MLEILNIIYSSNFLLTYATITAILIVLMVVINVFDYYTIQKRFRDLDFKVFWGKAITEHGSVTAVRDPNLKGLKSSLRDKY